MTKYLLCALVGILSGCSASHHLFKGDGPQTAEEFAVLVEQMRFLSREATDLSLLDFAPATPGAEKVVRLGYFFLRTANITFEEAACANIAGLTALQALRDNGRIRAGHKVLVNGAAGGVGTFAVQIAKALGADVTGVCSTRNVELVRSIGADRVIDYTREDFTKSGERYDLILDNVGNRSLSECRRALKPTGRYVMVGGPPGRWIDPLPRAGGAFLMSRFVSQELLFFVAQLNPQDLARGHSPYSSRRLPNLQILKPHPNSPRSPIPDPRSFILDPLAKYIQYAAKNRSERKRNVKRRQRMNTTRA